MKKFYYHILFFVLATNSFAINYFDSLNTDYKLVAFDSVISNYKIKNCNNTTIDQAIGKKLCGTLAPRLFDFSAWMIMRKQSVEKTFKQLEKREASLFSVDTFSFSKKVISIAGDKNSPIHIVAYVSTSCPLCKRVIIPLHMAVTNGPLTGLATLEIRPITTSVGDMGLMAAEKQGKAWEYYLSFEDEKRRLTEKIVTIKAKKINLEKNSFTKMLISTESKKLLNSYREEAFRNGVSVTPTLFINKRRYQSYKDPQWIIDAVEFEIEQSKASKK